MNTHNDSQPRGKETEPSSEPSPPSPTNASSAQTNARHIPIWQRHIHLYLPVIMSITLYFLYLLNFIFINVPVLALAAIPTYLVGSFVYPADQPEPSIEESERFTRKNELYRAAVLFTYGRLFGTPFKLGFFFSDLVLNFTLDAIISERPDGTNQTRSEFLVVLPWVLGSGLIGIFVPFTASSLGLVSGTIDRTLWRAMYVALVDDIIRILTWPHVRKLRGRIMLILVQAFIMVFIPFFAQLYLSRRMNVEFNSGPNYDAVQAAFTSPILSSRAS